YNNQSIAEILSAEMYNYANETNWDFDIASGSVIGHNARIFVHSQAGGANEAGSINVATAKTYWITQLWDGSNGVCKVEVYDPVTWTKIGNTSQLVLSNLPCEHLQFG